MYGGLEAALTRYVGWGVGVCMGDWRQPSLGMWGGELVCVVVFGYSVCLPFSGGW